MACRLGRPHQCLETTARPRRCRYHGLDGMNRWVGLGVIADNLVNTATFFERAGRRMRHRHNEMNGQQDGRPMAADSSCAVISSPESS